jgi:hypothetical protein
LGLGVSWLLAVTLGVSLPWSAPGAAAPWITADSTGIAASSHLAEIAAGRDGNLWFTEIVGNRAGKITPPGVVTEYSLGFTVTVAVKGKAESPAAASVARRDGARSGAACARDEAHLARGCPLWPIAPRQTGQRHHHRGGVARCVPVPPDPSSRGA